MYLRPLLLGTGPTLGLQPAPEVTFVIFSAAVGSYFKGGTLSAINLKIEHRYHRAAPLGVGAAKCAGKYLESTRLQRSCACNGLAHATLRACAW
jgi:branched-chain amino acid aminotransferase